MSVKVSLFDHSSSWLFLWVGSLHVQILCSPSSSAFLFRALWLSPSLPPYYLLDHNCFSHTWQHEKDIYAAPCTTTSSDCWYHTRTVGWRTLKALKWGDFESANCAEQSRKNLDTATEWDAHSWECSRLAEATCNHMRRVHSSRPTWFNLRSFTIHCSFLWCSITFSHLEKPNQRRSDN